MVFQKGHKFTPKKKEEVIEEIEITTEAVDKEEKEVETTPKTIKKEKKICVIERETKKLVSIMESEYSNEKYISI